ncbi:hypothetical protein GYMLUDRAFT_65102 [Collybiopsis luxurians FD-317 M1]|uniref:Nucleoplasmin-like domain-containing protein n=1 Tax=Collybiopsis luxurians FD-317 M1 TaxID=944289 RepID=A0A0D0AKZ5_9AGAR|nr:hypothetical protein GYMLUDRAFT_65102 [Collybiopsis luxurians FD-317 M1]
MEDKQLWNIIIKPNMRMDIAELIPGTEQNQTQIEVKQAALPHALNATGLCRTTISVICKPNFQSPLTLCTLVPIMVECKRLDFRMNLDGKTKWYILVEGPNSVNLSGSHSETPASWKFSDATNANECIETHCILPALPMGSNEETNLSGPSFDQGPSLPGSSPALSTLSSAQIDMKDIDGCITLKHLVHSCSTPVKSFEEQRSMGLRGRLSECIRSTSPSERSYQQKSGSHEFCCSQSEDSQVVTRIIYFKLMQCSDG